MTITAERVSRPTAAAEIQERARQTYRESLAEMRPLTGAELGAQFARSERWGLDRIKEVREAGPAPATAEDERHQEAAEERREAVYLARERAALEATAEEAGDAVAEAPDAVGNPEPFGPEAPVVQDVSPARAPAESGVDGPEPEEAEKIISAVSAEVGPHPGRGITMAWLALGLGGLVSIAANVGHVWFVSRPTDPAALRVSVGLAGLWPILLTVGVELLSRVAWKSLGEAGAWTARALVGAVALVAGVISYQHMHELLLFLGESPVTALIGPVGIDGLIGVGGLALLAIGENKRKNGS